MLLVYQLGVLSAKLWFLLVSLEWSELYEEGGGRWGLRNPSPDQLLPVVRAARALLAAGDTDAAQELLAAFSVDPAQAGPALGHPSATGSGGSGGEDGGTGPGRPETDALGPGQRPATPRPDPGHTSGRGA